MSSESPSEQAADQSRPLVSQPLKPCPFCGSSNLRHYVTDMGPPYQTSSVTCNDCSAGVNKSGLNAVDIWNTRKTESHLRTLLSEVGCCPAEWKAERYVTIQVPHDLLKEVVEEGESG